MIPISVTYIVLFGCLTLPSQSLATTTVATTAAYGTSSTLPPLTWSEWGPWAFVHASCGSQVVHRVRHCQTVNRKRVTTGCSGPNIDSRTVNLIACRVNGQLSQWSNWTTCSTTCGDGVTKRKRNCTTLDPSVGGADCSGEKEQTRTCSVRNCPVDGGWGDFSNWSACTASCGGGQRRRTRKCNNPSPSHGGRQCPGQGSEVEICKSTIQCPVDGSWGQWSHWSDCSASCGGGHRIRSRNCDSPAPSHGGTICPGTSIQYEVCSTTPCPVDGSWGQWSHWSDCSVSCGGGHRLRSRNCDSPVPSHRGRTCPGYANQYETCSTTTCPVDGVWGLWSQWSDCSKSCGDGNKRRSRRCDHPTPSHGGKYCTGYPYQYAVCSTTPCPVDGGWGLWSQWSDCSKSCGDGYKQRFRKCDNPTPSHGGRNCSGYAYQNGLCSTISCPDAECMKIGGQCQDIEQDCHGMYKAEVCNQGEHCCIYKKNVEFIGCFSYFHWFGISIGYHFQNHINTRRLATGQMTIDYCVGHCRYFGMLYAAPEFHSHCQCTNSIPSACKKVNNGACQATCDGDNSTFCGGIYKVSLYKIA